MMWLDIVPTMAIAGILSPRAFVQTSPERERRDTGCAAPPPAIDRDEVVKTQLLGGAADLAREVAAVEHAGASDCAEVLVFARAVRLAVEKRESQLPGTILAEGFFDERWRP